MLERPSIEIPKMTKAVCPGSYDPATKGHLSVIERGSKLFSSVTVAIGINRAKDNALFSLEERIAILEDYVKDLPNVTVDSYEDLTTDYARSINAGWLLRGIRNATDLAEEFDIEAINKNIDPEIQQFYLSAEPGLAIVSSSRVKGFMHSVRGPEIAAPYVSEMALHALCREFGHPIPQQAV